MTDQLILGDLPVDITVTPKSASRIPVVSLVPSPSLKRSKWDTSPTDDSRRDIRIKKRIAKPKKLRRQDTLMDDDVDTPGAGPSTPSSSRALSPVVDVHPNSPPSLTSGTARPMRRSPLAPPRSAHPNLLPCRSVYEYTRLNHIEEGTYGIVFRARCNETGEIYALKKLKLEEEKQGFPITSLREVMALMTTGGHENVVGVREIVVGETLNQWVVEKGVSRCGLGFANSPKRQIEYSSLCLSSNMTLRRYWRICHIRLCNPR